MTTDSGGWFQAPVDPDTYSLSFDLPKGVGPCQATEPAYGVSGTNYVTGPPREVKRRERLVLTVEVRCPLRPVVARLDRHRSLASRLALTVPSGRPVTPKLLVIDEAGIDLITSELPPDLRPFSPDEIRTVAVITCRGQVVGYYDTGHPAFRSDCEVLVVDLAEESLSFKRGFPGKDPSGKVDVRLGVPVSLGGGRPHREIFEYLSSLERAK